MSATEQQVPSWDFKSFAARYLPGFSFSFLGTGLVLVWIQCILYARYIWVDSGLTTVAINFARCGCIVVLGAVALWLVNVFGGLLGLHVAVNPFTALAVGFLGLPGAVLVVLLHLLL